MLSVRLSEMVASWNVLRVIQPAFLFVRYFAKPLGNRKIWLIYTYRTLALAVGVRRILHAIDKKSLYWLHTVCLSRRTRWRRCLPVHTLIARLAAPCSAIVNWSALDHRHRATSDVVIRQIPTYHLPSVVPVLAASGSGLAECTRESGVISCVFLKCRAVLYFLCKGRHSYISGASFNSCHWQPGSFRVT